MKRKTHSEERFNRILIRTNNKIFCEFIILNPKFKGEVTTDQKVVRHIKFIETVETNSNEVDIFPSFKKGDVLKNCEYFYGVREIKFFNLEKLVNDNRFDIIEVMFSHNGSGDYLDYRNVDNCEFEQGGLHHKLTFIESLETILDMSEFKNIWIHTYKIEKN